MDRSSVIIQDNSKVIFHDSIDGIKTASFGKRKKLYLNHVQFTSIDGKKSDKVFIQVFIFIFIISLLLLLAASAASHAA